MEQCDLSNSQPKRKRLRSIISVTGRVRRNTTQQDYKRIFECVLKVYLEAKICEPVGSSFALLDSSLRSSLRRWTPETAHTVIDFENAVKKALANAPELQAHFDERFLSDPRPHVVGNNMQHYNRTVTKCAREFLRRGMFPIHKWFRASFVPSSEVYATITES